MAATAEQPTGSILLLTATAAAERQAVAVCPPVAAGAAAGGGLREGVPAAPACLLQVAGAVLGFYSMCGQVIRMAASDLA